MELIAQLLLEFLLFSIKTRNILTIALSAYHVFHLPCNIPCLTCFGQESPVLPLFVFHLKIIKFTWDIKGPKSAFDAIEIIDITRWSEIVLLYFQLYPWKYV